MKQIRNSVNCENFGEGANIYTYLPFRNIRTTPTHKNLDVCGERKLLEGYIYVLSNPSMPEIYKVGMTSAHPTDRAKALSGSTGIPTPFVVESYYHVSDMAKTEANIHSELERYRVNGRREFFKCSLDTIFKALQDVASYITTESEHDVFYFRQIVCLGKSTKKTRNIKISQECYDLLESESLDSVSELAEQAIMLILNNLSCGLSIIDGKVVAFPSSEYGDAPEQCPDRFKPQNICEQTLKMPLRQVVNNG